MLRVWPAAIYYVIRYVSLPLRIRGSVGLLALHKCFRVLYYIGSHPYRPLTISAAHVYTISATGQTVSARSISAADIFGRIRIGHTFFTWKNVKFGLIADTIGQIKIGHRQIRPHPYRPHVFFNLDKCQNRPQQNQIRPHSKANFVCVIDLDMQNVCVIYSVYEFTVHVYLCL